LNLVAPKTLNGVDAGLLDPRDTYATEADWTSKAKQLAVKYIANFEQYCDNADAIAMKAAGPQL